MASVRRSAGDRSGARTLKWRPATAATVHTGPGCYALFRAGTLLYIGSAVNLRKRLSSHGLIGRMPKPQARFGDNKALQLRITGSRRFGDWLQREARLIRRLRPPLNTTHANRRGQAKEQ